MDRALAWWVRAYLIFAAFQGLGLGVTGLVSPDDIQVPLRMSPLNERFVAALYFAGGVGVLAAAFSRRQSGPRLFVLGFAFATAVILLLTLAHWNDFMADGLSHRASWIGAYVLDPLLGAIVIPAAGYLRLPPRTRHPLTPLLLVQAAVMGLLGVLLLVVPGLVAAAWPWTLPPVLGQLYACFFLAFALGAYLAAGESQAWPIRVFLVSSLSLAVAVLAASLLHLARFSPGPATWIWFAAFGAGAVAFLVALLVQRRAGASSAATSALQPQG